MMVKVKPGARQSDLFEPSTFMKFLYGFFRVHIFKEEGEVDFGKLKQSLKEQNGRNVRQ